MIRVWTQRLAPPDLQERFERRRKEVFIDEMGWDLTHVDGRERDQFDRPGAQLLVAGLPPVFAMRIIHEQRCMVRELWPEAAQHITPGSWEMSRWVSMRQGVPLRETRECVRQMIEAFRERHWWDMFSVATDKIVRAHRVMGMEPKRVIRIGPDINLCKWNIRTVNNGEGEPTWQ